MTAIQIPGDLIARAQVTAGLRALADFLDAHPGVPVPEHGWEVGYYPQHPADPARMADVDQIAGLLGVPVTDNTPAGGHYTAARTFGRITYQATAVLARRRAEHQAFWSYHGHIHPADVPGVAR